MRLTLDIDADDAGVIFDGVALREAVDVSDLRRTTFFLVAAFLVSLPGAFKVEAAFVFLTFGFALA